jgi:hypothetical protein
MNKRITYTAIIHRVRWPVNTQHELPACNTRAQAHKDAARVLATLETLDRLLSSYEVVQNTHTSNPFINVEVGY